MVPPRSALITLSAMILSTATAWPQQSPMPADIATKLQEIGRVVDPPMTAPLYAPLQEKEPYQGLKIERDVEYGPKLLLQGHRLAHQLLAAGVVIAGRQHSGRHFAVKQHFGGCEGAHLRRQERGLCLEKI